MEKRTGKFYALLPMVIALSIYLVFFDRIASKPGDAGFWIILAMGMSIGVALTRFVQWPDTKKKDK
jgi:hypothetical protein